MADHNCDEAVAKLYDFLDDELTWFRKARVRYHLRSCPPCEMVFVFETTAPGGGPGAQPGRVPMLRCWIGCAG